VNNRDNTRTEIFAYDSLNRIASGESNGTHWGETFTIDAWGNLTNEAGITGKTYHESLSTSAGTNNRLSGFGYDAAGNMTSNGTASYVYDAENHLIWTTGYRYVYDGDGQRAEKCLAATATTACPTSGTTNGTLYWRGLGSDALAETDLSGNVVEDYIFFNGQRVARRDASTNAIHYYFSDHLGSHGVVENATASACEQDIDYYPYGGVQNDYCAVVPQKYKFTGKERDAESGLDNFGARYDASGIGRFMTTDPVVITTERLKSPQQLNLYSYVANNPLRFIDPTGALLMATGNQQADYNDLCAIAGSACADRLKIDEKTGNVTFDTTGLDLSKNEGAALVNDLVTSKNTYEFSEGPTVMTDKGPVKIDYLTANLPTFGDQPKDGNPRASVSDVVALYLNNPKVTQASNTSLKVALGFTIGFHELAEAYEKIDGGKGGSYAAGHNAALQREEKLRDQRPYLKDYNTGAGGPANSPHPEGKIIIKQ